MMLLQYIFSIEHKANYVNLFNYFPQHTNPYIHMQNQNKQKNNLRYTPQQISFKRAKTCVYLW